ncbi:hypothetical protein EN858_33080 [Mesorhizobium sp. M4B.F.Ca.ET.215.01.1.1]|uniref:ATP-dependent Clp protease proteolytic subunit n=1 Tax=Mesorhizobium sp. M4B.F.Ca.ET.200.01.1.1 TaxID=2563952 RepID=UPI000FC9B1EF|nr:hypothetical protein EN741_20500 [Mesorhizobium sp. M4B.F.Ca.ET.019.03.1.1]RWF60041.1 MAG: hypothetical protein EOS47_31745 [Mesorhizobium sp.]TGQ04047.1 hypothetical protein EN858_33080 [Mesorhizobium sp. M4B.F.Ca.ET.215.01.1.1]TGQ24451.1 hypothetical protein EN863_062035 [Mesorhizobium sp. M00.F.Ca.ET.220.01.1.1]TGQ27698.1 hypothetical protein EN857_32640 [Mesorhizobium sp. M4B.F.Ca.ET.214.01.1.1]TGQ54865.1 hypothetical protein EN854_32650 [Mesorhizobium sp. M4B.F.Ca.ET.211.01.1.1]TGQ966
MVQSPSFHSPTARTEGSAAPGGPASTAPMDLARRQRSNGRKEPPGDERLLVGSNVQVNGMINDQLFLAFMKQLGAVRASDEDLILELMTQGGDADTAKRMALEIRVFQRYSGKSAYVVGKTAVMSAGVTIFSAFECADRFLSPDTTLLIHERHIEKTITLQGPIKSCRQVIREELAALETAERVEREDFEHFVRGSGMSAEDLVERAKENCYLTAQEALDLRLIARIID